MKIFISQPMGKRTAEEVWNERKQIVEELEKDGHEILNNIFTDKIPEDLKNPDIYYLTKAIELLMHADAVYFIPGWEKSRGCLIEYKIVNEYKIPIYYKNNYEE